MIDSTIIERARALFKSFQKREPKPAEIIAIARPAKDVVALEVGTLVSIGYRASGSGETFYHEFQSKRPTLYVAAGGEQIFIVGGVYRFTERGFIK